MTYRRIAAIAFAMHLGAAAGADEMTVITPFDFSCQGTLQAHSCSMPVSLGGAVPGKFDRLRIRVEFDQIHASINPQCGSCSNGSIVGEWFPTAGIDFIDAPAPANETVFWQHRPIVCSNGNCVAGSLATQNIAKVWELQGDQLPDELAVYIGWGGTACSNCFGGVVNISATGRVIATIDPTPMKRIVATERAMLPSALTGPGDQDHCGWSPFPKTKTPEVPENTLPGQAVGVVQEVVGTSTITRHDTGEIEAIAVGTLVNLGDTIETAKGASATIVFVDESFFTVSEIARLEIDEYVYDADVANCPSRWSWLRGLFVYTSGLIGREDPDEIDLEGPIGTIGIRGDAADYINIGLDVQVTNFALTGGPGSMAVVRPFNMPSGVFQIALDYLSLDQQGTLTVSIDDHVIGQFDYADMNPMTNGYERVTIPVNSANLPLFNPVELRLTLSGPIGSRVLIDNVTGPGLTNPGFDNGERPWFARGDGRAALIGTSVDAFCLSSGEFSSGVFKSLGGVPKDIAVADLNLDGKMDVVIVTDLGQDHSGISSALGNGQGGFQTHVPLQVQNRNLRNIVLIDVTGDGIRDIIASADFLYDPVLKQFIDFGGVLLATGDGDGTFQPFVHLIGAGVNHVLAADADSDSRTDILFTMNYSTFHVLRNLGGGAFQIVPSAVNVDSGSISAAADFNDDGHVDVAGTRFNGNAIVAFGNGDGTFGPLAQFPIGSAPGFVEVGDLNNDGALDLAIGHQTTTNGGIAILFNDGNGGFMPEVRYATQQYIPSLAICDLNGDEYLDILSATNNASVALIGKGNGLFYVTSMPFPGTHAGNINVTDMDRNGTQDVILRATPPPPPTPPNAASIAVFRNGCTPWPEPAEPGDINGDGVVNVNDLLAVINAWGACPAPPPDCPADISPPPNGDGVVNVNDLLMVINNWG